MVYLVLIYALIYTLGEFVSRRIGLPHCRAVSNCESVAKM